MTKGNARMDIAEWLVLALAKSPALSIRVLRLSQSSFIRQTLLKILDYRV